MTEATNRAFMSTNSQSLPVTSASAGMADALPRFSDIPLPAGAAPVLDVGRLVWAFVAIGVALRLSRYLALFPLWGDEYQLAANFLNRNFSDLLRPLDHNQVAPLGFVAMELVSIKCLGFSELSLRFFPALCAVGSVFLFRLVASRILGGLPLVAAMGIFAVSYYPIRLGAEVKPYASDLFCALALTVLAVQWWQNPKQIRWLWGMVVLAPITLAISFPAAFVTGGLSLGIAWTLWQGRSVRHFQNEAIAWIVFNLVVAISFYCLMRLSVGVQYEATRNEMTQCWSDGFPPWREPMQLLLWLANVHTSEMFAYPFGAEHGASVGTFLLFVVGVAATVRRKQYVVVMTIGGWFGLSLVAAALHRYPYGGHARLSQYLAPAICLLSGAGGAVVVTKLKDLRWQVTAVRIGLGACIVIACVLPVRDRLRPWKVALDHGHREFARRFWQEFPEEVPICLKTDLGLDPYSNSFETAYLCNQRIYSPAHRNEKRDVRAIVAAADRPLRCVAMHSASASENGTVLADWMVEMLHRYDLTGRERHEVRLFDRQDALAGLYRQCYDVYHFVPRAPESAPQENAAPQIAREPTSESNGH